MVNPAEQNRDGYAKFACKCRGGSFYVRGPAADHNPQVFILREYAEAEPEDTATEGDDNSDNNSDDNDDNDVDICAGALVDLYADMPALEHPA
jgi:hypothetical protein